jgi:hypothetical protein
MLGPTIYIPSGLAKLLIPLTTCRQSSRYLPWSISEA